MLGGWERRLLAGSGHVCCTFKTEVDGLSSDTLVQRRQLRSQRETKKIQWCVSEGGEMFL
jgi:hypothetical protein